MGQPLPGHHHVALLRFVIIQEGGGKALISEMLACHRSRRAAAAAAPAPLALITLPVRHECFHRILGLLILLDALLEMLTQCRGNLLIARH